MWNLTLTDCTGKNRNYPISKELIQIDELLEEEFSANSNRRLHCNLEKTERSDFPFEIQSETWIHVAGIPTKRALIPVDTPISIENYRIEIRKRQNLFTFPTQVKASKWLTQCQIGRKCLHEAFQVAKTDLSIWLKGESGSGKELIANSIHQWSANRKGNLVVLNCGAIPNSLFESELFGHIRGAFTGAHQSRMGAARKANKGTLFLDEIADLDPSSQAKLLRFLENSEVKPVGSDQTIRVETRFLCATHQNLETEVREGRFREDLYYRIASIRLDIPALRERKSDISFLSKKFSKEHGKFLGPDTANFLLNQRWPGNVRQLKHAIHRAAALSGERNVLKPTDFSFLQKTANETKCYEIDLDQSLDSIERAAVIRTLQMNNGNRTQTARALGIARSTLQLMIKRHQLEAFSYPMVKSVI